jgi:hypothetical protein
LLEKEEKRRNFKIYIKEDRDVTLSTQGVYKREPKEERRSEKENHGN